MIVNLDYVKGLIFRKEKVKELGIGPGVLQIINSANGNKTELNEDDINFLAAVLKSNPVLNTLHLQDCILSDTHGALARLIAECNISSIIFTGIDLNNSILTEIGEGLKQNSSLQNITFDKVNLELGNGLNILTEGLESNSSRNTVMFRSANLSTYAIDKLINIADSQVPRVWSKFYILCNNPELNQTQQESIVRIKNSSMGIRPKP